MLKAVNEPAHAIHNDRVDIAIVIKILVLPELSGDGLCHSCVDRYGGAIFSTVRLFVATGFLGAYTTFSTFAQETHDLLAGDHVLLGLANAALSVSIGIAAVVAGAAVGRAL